MARKKSKCEVNYIHYKNHMVNIILYINIMILFLVAIFVIN